MCVCVCVCVLSSYKFTLVTANHRKEETNNVKTRFNQNMAINSSANMLSWLLQKSEIQCMPIYNQNIIKMWTINFYTLLRICYHGSSRNQKFNICQYVIKILSKYGQLISTHFFFKHLLIESLMVQKACRRYNQNFRWNKIVNSNLFDFLYVCIVTWKWTLWRRIELFLWK